MISRLVGGPGDGVMMDIAPARDVWVWEQRGRTTRYLRHATLNVCGATQANEPALFFAEDISEVDKAKAVSRLKAN